MQMRQLPGEEAKVEARKYESSAQCLANFSAVIDSILIWCANAKD